jgi:chorismate-pyruvate lyase
LTTAREVDPGAANFLYPLSEFLACAPLESVTLLETGEAVMPEPYRALLVHDRDMTSTLERFHQEPIVLRSVASKQRGRSLFRQVVLLGMRSGAPLEFGAIRIDLAGFSSLAQEEILEARKPLGAILADHAVAYESRPQCFFSLRSDPCMEELLELESLHRLYGRQNVLWGPGGQPLAEVVEILPRVVSSSSGR